VRHALYDRHKFRVRRGKENYLPCPPDYSYPLDKYLYAQRHLVECCFSKLKQFRRVATRFEKHLEITAPSSLSLPSSYGCDKCPHALADDARRSVLNLRTGRRDQTCGGFSFPLQKMAMKNQQDSEKHAARLEATTNRLFQRYPPQPAVPVGVSREWSCRNSATHAEPAESPPLA
jgi:hypothetical protein